MATQTSTRLIKGPWKVGTFTRAEVRKTIEEVYAQLGIQPLWGGGKTSKIRTKIKK